MISNGYNDVYTLISRTASGYSSLGQVPTITGPTQVGADYWQFDGTDDYIEINASTLFSIDRTPQTWTVAMWVWNDSNVAGSLFGDIGLDNSINFSIELNTSKYLCVYWNNTQVASYSSQNTASWNHLAVTYDGTNCILYRNGTAVKTVAQSFETISKPATSKFRIGGAAASNGHYFQGRIKDIRIYKAALIAEDIKAMRSVQMDKNGWTLAREFIEEGSNNGYIVGNSVGNQTIELTGTPLSSTTVQIYSYKTQAGNAGNPQTNTAYVECQRYTYTSSIYNLPTNPIRCLFSITPATTIERITGSFPEGDWRPYANSGSNTLYKWESTTCWYAHYLYQIVVEILDNNNNLVASTSIQNYESSQRRTTSGPYDSAPVSISTVNNNRRDIPFTINDNGNGTKFRIKIIFDIKNNNTPSLISRTCTINFIALTPQSLCSIDYTNKLHCSELIESSENKIKIINGTFITHTAKEM